MIGHGWLLLVASCWLMLAIGSAICEMLQAWWWFRCLMLVDSCLRSWKIIQVMGWPWVTITEHHKALVRSEFWGIHYYNIGAGRKQLREHLTETGGPNHETHLCEDRGRQQGVAVSKVLQPSSTEWLRLTNGWLVLVAMVLTTLTSRHTYTHTSSTIPRVTSDHGLQIDYSDGASTATSTNR